MYASTLYSLRVQGAYVFYQERMRTMSKQTRNDKRQKSHKAKRGTRGFTLVELCIVMALIAVVATAAISFYALMSGTLKDNRIAYEYLEDHATLKSEFDKWAAEKDTPDSVFSVTEDGKLTVTEDGETQTVSFSRGTLSLGGKYVWNLDKISGISFSVDETGTLIKCTTYHTNQNGERIESRFVFSRRCEQTQNEVVGNE